jgi:protein pelota
VKGIDFDTNEGGQLRLSGRTVGENKFVKVGSFHTLELEVHRAFTLGKAEWDAVALGRLEEACSERTRASVAALVMAEGVANLCLLTDQLTITKAHITQNIPRKRKASTGHHDKSLERFFQSCYDALVRNVDWKIVKCVVIASPGFVKDQFHEFVLATATRTDCRPIIENKSKFLLVHSSSGHKHSLTEVLKDKTVQAQMSDTKAAREVQALSQFFDMLKKEPDRAVYGFKHVQLATSSSAVQTLLLSDNLFRSRRVETRKSYVELVQLVKSLGGEVLIFSSMHVSGEQLAQLSGVAATLRFPIPGLDDELEDEPTDGPNNDDDDDGGDGGGHGSDDERVSNLNDSDTEAFVTDTASYVDSNLDGDSDNDEPAPVKLTQPAAVHFHRGVSAPAPAPATATTNAKNTAPKKGAIASKGKPAAAAKKQPSRKNYDDDYSDDDYDDYDGYDDFM